MKTLKFILDNHLYPGIPGLILLMIGATLTDGQYMPLSIKIVGGILLAPSLLVMLITITGQNRRFK